MRVKLFQIVLSKDEKTAAFRSLNELTAEGLTVDPKIYQVVFDGETTCDDLDEVAMMFIDELPEGYTGRHLGVSDVVKIGRTFYYYDVSGFVKIKFSEAAAAEQDKNLLQVVVVEPGKPARTEMIESGLMAIEKIIGEKVDIFEAITNDEDDVAIFHAEMGIGEPNRVLYGDDDKGFVVNGTFVIAGYYDFEITGLSDDLADKYVEMFCNPENFDKLPGGALYFEGDREIPCAPLLIRVLTRDGSYLLELPGDGEVTDEFVETNIESFLASQGLQGSHYKWELVEEDEEEEFS